jgi:transcriptional regulator with XRE-family HTH domain
MVLDLLSHWFSDSGDVPNRFTVAMGKLIREARLEARMSQKELARLIYRRQGTLSDIENGKIRVDTETIVYLALNLNKPVSYFFPERLVPRVACEGLSVQEQELLLLVRQLDDDDLARLIAIARSFFDLQNNG